MSELLYEELAVTTASDKMHLDRADFHEVREALVAVVELSEKIDFIKKSLFHGSRSTPNELNINTWPDHIFEHKDLIHSVLGLISESGELAEAILYGLFTDVRAAKLDELNIKEEMGDQFWYLALLSRYSQVSFKEAQVSNNEKLLKVRYKNGFSTEACLARDVKEERAVI